MGFVRILWGFVALQVAPVAFAQEANPLTWVTLPEAIATNETRQPILVYVHADWCGPCARLEQEVFPKVRPLLNRFARVALGFDDHTTEWAVGGVRQSPFAWGQHFGIEAPPAFVFLDASGQIITHTVGFIEAEAFSILLAYVATGAYQHATFAAYAEHLKKARASQ